MKKPFKSIIIVTAVVSVLVLLGFRACKITEEINKKGPFNRYNLFFCSNPFKRKANKRKTDYQIGKIAVSFVEGTTTKSAKEVLNKHNLKIYNTVPNEILNSSDSARLPSFHVYHVEVTPGQEDSMIQTLEKNTIVEYAEKLYFLSVQ